MNSKQKGSAFEREVCKKLSLWVTKGAKADAFWRSAMSGGRATVAHARGRDVRQAGDITAVAPEGHILDSLYIECKFYKNLDIDSFILISKGKLADFWRKTAKQAHKLSRTPWLIAKENRTPPLLIARLDDDIIRRVAYRSPGWNDPQPVCQMQIDGNPCQIWFLGDLFKLTWRSK